jgi:Putative bacterial sensory transduction regulator
VNELRDRAINEVRAELSDLDLKWSETAPGLFTVSLPGTRKLITECALEVGQHAMQIRAFVARNPDENHVGVYRWLLERNLRLHGICFAADALGDIYLTGRVPVELVTQREVDRILGAVAETADDSFNVILELGFAESIRKEWVWRRSRGESTANLAAFTHLDPEGGRLPGTSRDPGERPKS